MPTWGLTDKQVESEPWGIPQEYLRPAKTITDPIHGDIYLTKLECLLVDSPPMQRLRGVRQLGTTHLVYPSATHTRFSHSLGTLRGAQDLLDAVWSSRTSPHVLPDNLLSEWYEEDDREGAILSDRFAHATVLARLGGLLHDLCHVPIGHTIEDDLGVLESHDHNAKRLEGLWAQMDPEVTELIANADGLWDELRVLIVSKDAFAKQFVHGTSRFPFVADIVGNTICADLADYIRRDHHNTGLPLALGRRFMDSFFVTSADHQVFPARMVIGIARNGRVRNDVITELVKFLRYRYELTERVLTHHAKTAADAMLGKLLGLWDEHLWLETAQRLHPGVMSASAELDALTVTEVTERVDAGHKGRRKKPSELIRTETTEILERRFLRHSDDGLLEHVRDLGLDGSRRLARASELAGAIIDRQLYKEIGRAASDEDRAIAREVYERFGNGPAARRDLERRAAQFVDLDPETGVAIWMPDPEMRLKVARVLVHQDGMVAPLSEVDSTSGEIVALHRALWGATVYAPGELKLDENRQRLEALLAFLRDETGLAFRLPNGRRVPGCRELAAEWLERDINTKTVTKQQLMELPVAAMDAGPSTFNSLIQSMHESAIDHELLASPRRRRS